MTEIGAGRKMENIAHEIARRVLGRRRYPIREMWNRITLGHTVPALRRFEDAEVRRLSGEVTLPPARVAVIMATYKRPELLLSAVRSALAQTIEDIVVLVVDDGGGLPGLPDDPRLQACSLSVNSKVLGVVLNIGIRLTRSTYVAFLDDDNEWEPNHLEEALAVLEGPAGKDRPRLVYTALKRSFPDGRLMDVLSTPFDRRLLAYETFVDTNSLVIKRFPGLHFSRMRRPADVRPKEDWELVYRLTRRSPAKHVPVPTVRYQVNPKSYFSDWSAALETKEA